MKQIKKLLKNKGEAYIDTLINIFIVMVFIVIIIITLPVFIKKYHLDMYTNQISTFIAVSGGTENIDPEQYALEMGIDLDDIDITIADDAVTKENIAEDYVRIQLTGRYTVTVKTTAYIGLGGVVGDLPIELTSVAQGRSEVFWKDMEEP